MKKVIIISLFVLGMIIPNISAKAIDVSNEEELRNAIEQGGDITLTNDIEVNQPLVIDKDVNISGRYHIMMQGDNTLMTINDGNVTLNNVKLYAGWNGKYKYGTTPDNVVKGQGTGLVVKGGTVYVSDRIYAGKLGFELNGGTVTGYQSISAGVKNDNGTYSGGQGMIVNGGNVELYGPDIYSGGTALTVDNGSNLTLADGYIFINSYEENGIEVNDGSIVNVNSKEYDSAIFGSKNAIYLNGGTANLSGHVGLSSSTTGKGIYINKGVNTVTGGDILNLGKDFVFGYDYGTTPNFSIYVNPDITELRVTDEKEFMELLNNKLNLGFCGGFLTPISQTEEERRATCSTLGVNYDGLIESNELGKCTTVYINSVKQNEPGASCNPVVDNENEPSQVVNVPATSAYASIIIITLGILCVVVSVIVTRRVTKKKN